MSDLPKAVIGSSCRSCRMKTGTWRNVFLFLAKVSKLDINEELQKENEYLKAEIDIYRKQLEQLEKRPQFTNRMRMRLVEKALTLGRRASQRSILRWKTASEYEKSREGRPHGLKEMVEHFQRFPKGISRSVLYSKPTL